MGQHKKSKSWSALVSLPTMLTPSSSTSTQQPPTDQADDGTIEMKKSNSHQQHHHHHHHHSNDPSNEKDEQDEPIIPSIPLFYLFSSEALANEYAPEDSIIPYMEPPTLAWDQATLIAGVLESLVRVVDDIPTTSTDGRDRDDDTDDNSRDDDWTTADTTTTTTTDDDQSPSPFTIIGLGSFKVALWPSILTGFSQDQNLSLVVLISPTYPDHTIIDIMNNMKLSLHRQFTSVEEETTNIAELVGQHLSPLIKNGFSIEYSF